MICRVALIVLVVLAAAALAGCANVLRTAYNNVDYALRLMVDEYFDLQAEQTDLLKVQLARFHEWHRREELPTYARLFRGAAERVSRGLERDDVLWAIVEVRGRYRVLVAQAAEESAPVVAMLKPDNFAAIERKFAEVNTKFAREYLAGDQTKRDRARAKWLEERFALFMGDLTGEQRELISRFVRSQPRMIQVRLDDRKRRQQEFVQLIGQYRGSTDLAEQLRGFFVNWERDRGPEHAELTREWEDRLVTLVVELDHTMTAEQRRRVIERFESYAEDCRVLARQGLPLEDARAAVAPEPSR